MKNVFRQILGYATVLLVILGWGSATAQTLENVRERGFLVCAASNSLPGFSTRNAEGVWTGFDVDLCRAIAAATLGDPDLVEFRPLSGDSRFALLQIGEVDVVARNASWTMTRDVQFGARYVTTSFFDGQSFLVRQELGHVSAFELSDLSICVASSGDDLAKMRDFFFTTQATYEEVIYEDHDDLAVAYQAGLCDAITGSSGFLQAVRRNLPEPAQNRITPELISKTPFGPTVRADDDQWADIVRWTVFALINAEELGVSSQNLESMLSARTPAIKRLLGVDQNLGEGLGLEQDWARVVISAIGNYRELYERHFGSQTGAELPRGRNALWTQGGLLYAPPMR